MRVEIHPRLFQRRFGYRSRVSFRVSRVTLSWRLGCPRTPRAEHFGRPAGFPSPISAKLRRFSLSRARH